MDFQLQGGAESRCFSSVRIAYAFVAGIAVAMPIDGNAADGNSDK